PTAQIRRLGALAKIQVSAFRAELIIKMVEVGVMLFADVTMLRFDAFAEIRIVFNLDSLDAWRGKRVGSIKDRPTAQFSNAGLAEDLLFPLQFLVFSLAYPGFDEASLLFGVGQDNFSCSLE